MSQLNTAILDHPSSIDVTRARLSSRISRRFHSGYAGYVTESMLCVCDYFNPYSVTQSPVAPQMEKNLMEMVIMSVMRIAS